MKELTVEEFANLSLDEQFKYVSELANIAAESVEDEVRLPAFRDLEPARLGKLTGQEYESFLAGMAPSKKLK